MLWKNPSISFTEEACLNQINWTCDNEWHYLITNLINVISQSTNWTVQKRNWHQKQHPLADKKCDVSLSDHVRVNRKENPENLFKSFYSWKVYHFPQMSGGRKNKKQTIIFRNTDDRPSSDIFRSSCASWFRSEMLKDALMFPSFKT